jgi:hypothetical protein
MALSLTVILGILTIISLVITFIFGILMKRGKPVFKYHKLFAYLTIILAVIHTILVLRVYYF